MVVLLISPVYQIQVHSKMGRLLASLLDTRVPPADSYISTRFMSQKLGGNNY